MKIAILTQPLHRNYGGILQAYALSTVLNRMGHSVIVVNREYYWGGGNPTTIKNVVPRIGSFIKTAIRIYLFNQKDFILINPFSPYYHTKISGVDSLPFVKQYIRQSSEIRTSIDLKKYFKRQKFEVYVVGSDQVWRPCYSPCITDFFLKELPLSSKALRISYAASFGTDSWEFSQEETIECASLVKAFDAISVREQSGVQMCREHFGIEAIHLLDPTMLLDIKDYIDLIEKAETKKNAGNLFCYILDENSEADKIISSLNNDGYVPYYAGLDLIKSDVSVEQWLRNIYDAVLVVTDSFHACVFSILFKKPFIVINNRDRGTSRLESLLGTFGLERYLVESFNDYIERREEIEKEYNVEKVSAILNQWREKAQDFLKSVGLLDKIQCL